MPFVRIDYVEGQYKEVELAAVSQNIQTALIDQFHVPADDCFQVFHSHKTSEFIYDPRYLDVTRSERLLYIQITCGPGRTIEQKRSLYRQLSDSIAAACGISTNDVFALLSESELENWTFGKGEAQMIDTKPDWISGQRLGLEDEELVRIKNKPNKHKAIATSVSAAYGKIAPAFVQYTEEVLFGEVWRRSELSLRERSLITVSALMTGGNVKQLDYHFKLAKENGISEEELAEAVTHLAFYTGWPRADSALQALKTGFENE